MIPDCRSCSHAVVRFLDVVRLDSRARLLEQWDALPSDERTEELSSVCFRFSRVGPVRCRLDNWHVKQLRSVDSFMARPRTSWACRHWEGE